MTIIELHGIAIWGCRGQGYRPSCLAEQALAMLLKRMMKDGRTRFIESPSEKNSRDYIGCRRRADP
jgi:hypothetical protein